MNRAMQKFCQSAIEYDEFGRIAVCFLDDPDTPVIVAIENDTNYETATFDCANDTGEIGGINLTRQEMQHLAENEEAANDHYNEFRRV